MPRSAIGTNVHRRVRFLSVVYVQFAQGSEELCIGHQADPAISFASWSVPARTTRSERDGPGDNCCSEQHNAMGVLERFRAKWTPVRVSKTRQNQESRAPFRFYRNGKGSRHQDAPRREGSRTEETRRIA